ncbi:MAG: aminotransferase class I/II-fold pyridoxal phosphate-dependent enzyme [Promethearchaeota archaeon]
MQIHQFLSDNGNRIRKDLNLADGPPEWGLRAKQKALSNPNFINATVGTAQSETGFYFFPTLLKEMQNLSSEEIFGYASMRGVLSFKEAWKKDTINSYHPSLREKANSLTSDPVPITGGLTGALFTAGQMFLDQGTQVLAPRARWGNVDNCLSVSLGATIQSFDLYDKEGHFTFDLLRRKIVKISPSVSRLIIYLNFPNNPTGYMPTVRDVEKLQDILREVSFPTIIFLDDAYEGYVYETGRSSQENPIPHSIFPYLLGLNEYVLPVKIDGPSKRFCAYGTRLGMISLGFNSEEDAMTDVGFKTEGLDFTETFTKAARGHCSSAPRGIQEALGRILSDENKLKAIKREREALKSLLEKRYWCFLQEIQKQSLNPVLKPLDFNSGFFGFFHVHQYSAKTLALECLDNGIGIVPFENKQTGLNGVRFAFCSVQAKDIPRAIELLWYVSQEKGN